MPSTFTKLAFGYLLLQVATYAAYLVSGELPSLSHTYLQRPDIFWLAVATIMIAATYARQAHRRMVELSAGSLPDTPGGDRLAVFFPALRVMTDPIRYTNRHPRYIGRIAYVMMGLAFLALMRIWLGPEKVPTGGAHTIEILSLMSVSLYCLTLLAEEYYRGYLFQARFLRRIHKRRKAAEQAIHDAEILRVRNRQHEDVMALVAHKFRGSLDRIIYNIEHDNDERIYREAVDTMRGLLDIFSLISTDAQRLRHKLQADSTGPATLAAVTTASLTLALGQLLSLHGSGRIQQHLFAYARRHALVPPETNLRAWHEEHFEVGQRLQGEFEASLMSMASDADLATLVDWCRERFFPLHLNGFGDADIHFAAHGIKASYLTIVLTEAFTNMFKYYLSDANEPATASWHTDEHLATLAFENPTTPFAAAMVKGSGRGHDFLKLLMAKLDGTLEIDATGQSFAMRLALPSALFVEAD